MFKKVGFVIICIFALIGLVFTGVFIAMQFGLFNVRGSALERDKFFEQAVAENSHPLASKLAADTSLSSVQVAEIPDPAIDCTQVDSFGHIQGICDWNRSGEWSVVRAGLAKDQAVINRVASQTGVSARLIAAAVVPEQLRYFTSDRENFKKVFEPFMVLGSLTKFSLGVSGIKLDTAKQIEQFANDASSSFYPGAQYQSMIAYASPDGHDDELYNRLTNQKDHYYSYLYTALFLIEIQNQWTRSGHRIDDRADVLTTLFNIGFAASKPNANPKAGGSVVTLGVTKFSFGQLGQLFFQSGELSTQFPR